MREVLNRERLQPVAGRVALPIDSLLPEIVASLRTAPNLVLEAAPGAGKTTRVPAALLEAFPGEVLVLEPRRIAARMAARRVASERGETPGETVGFQVRFEDVSGPRTRLRFMTEGVFTRRLLRDPELRGVDAVVLDEFHERHLDTDLALALVRRLQERRPELRLLVMSATLNTGPVAKFLGECPVLRSAGRAFPLHVRHLPYSPQLLEQQVRAALEVLVQEGHTGHVLVFLPGAAEIRRALRESEALARRTGALLLPLHGDLPPAEQDLAVGPSSRQKWILSTNVAESSVTIEGVSAVIDSGLARVASHSPWTGLPTLEVRRISKASATQRAGRAGRTGPGTALRLYPEEDFVQRPEQDTPEILRGDLSGLALTLRAMGVPHIGELAWLDAPPAEAVMVAERLLDRLGAHGEDARELARLPLAPRLGRMLLQAGRTDVLPAAVAAAALLNTGARSVTTDLLAAIDASPDAKTRQQQQQQERLLRVGRPAKGWAATQAGDEGLQKAVLAGFPDRVARLRPGRQVQLATGVSAELAGEPPLYEWMVVVDAEDRKDKAQPVVRMTSRVEPEWLLDMFPDRLRDETEVVWHRAGERVEAVSRLWYDNLVLEESRNGLPPQPAAANLLAAQAMEAGLERFVDREALSELLARLAFAGLTAPDLAAEVRLLCEGLRSFAELRESMHQFLPVLEARGGTQLREGAPASLRLQGGRQTRVHYEAGKPPWIASRLQDFFGMRDTPRIGRERTPVVVHLLAPNHRPVQTTMDLAGFWERLYPQVRRELMRRYPRHAWPEKPTTG